MAEPRGPHPRTTTIDPIVAGKLDRAGAERSQVVSDDHSRSLLQITSALADAVTPEEVHEAIVDRTAAALSASSCALWLSDGRVLRLARQVGYSTNTTVTFAEVPIDAEPSIPLLDAFRRAQPLWIPSQRDLLDRYPHLVGAATKGRAYRVSCLPLASEGGVLGALGITLDEERESTESERSFLLLVARYAAQALQRLRMLEAERRSRQRADAVARRMTILSHASRAFTEVDVDHQQRLRNIVREVGTLLDGSTTIALVRADGRLHHVATYHPDPEADALIRSLAERFPLSGGEGVSGQVRQTGQAVLLGQLDPATLAERAPAAYRELVERFPIHAVMIAPLRVRGRVFGTISASRVRAGQTFDADDLELLEGLADRAAAAIENSRLNLEAEEARRRAERLQQESEEARYRAEQLYRFANAAVNARTLDEVFDAALTTIGHVLQTERASILLSGDDGVMRFSAWRGLSEQYRAAVEGHSPWSRDEPAPEPVLVADCLGDPAWAKYEAVFRAEALAALAFIPLVSRGHLLGKFTVYYDARHAFSTSELEVARAIANHLGSMIARFRAVAELERTIRDNELFAGVLAHDLRNPLASIVTATQFALMQGEGAGDHVQKPLVRILSSAERMRRMIEQLLDFTRVRVGNGITVRRAPGSLLDVAEQVVAELELVYPACSFNVTSRGDHHGCWDPDRLLQVVSNLVGNACQHGSAGAMIGVSIDGAAPDAVTLAVHNEGAIPPALLPHLFDPFRGGERRRSNANGLGLGLFIVREIVRAHHGSVEVTSTASGGTTFSVRLSRA